LTEIGNEAFFECFSLKKLYLPKSITSVTADWFESIKIEEGKIEGERMRKGEPENIMITKTDPGESYDGLTIILKCESGLEIKEKAFAFCERLRSVDIGSDCGATAIGTAAFYKCQALKSVTVPGSVKIIDESSFSECRNLKTVIFVGESRLEIIGYGAFRICLSLESIKIPRSVENLGVCCFAGCWGLKRVEFEEGSVLRGRMPRVFVGCASLESIKIPAGVEIIDEGCFAGCAGLKKVEFDK
jgi:hypothetical protein